MILYQIAHQCSLGIYSRTPLVTPYAYVLWLLTKVPSAKIHVIFAVRREPPRYGEKPDGKKLCFILANFTALPIGSFKCSRRNAGDEWIYRVSHRLDGEWIYQVSYRLDGKWIYRMSYRLDGEWIY